jgi:hypothetical protein
MNGEKDNKVSTAIAIQERESFLFQLTPEALSHQVANETALRKILTQYVREQLQEDHHYYYLNDKQKEDGGKPALAKDGALNISSLFKVTPLAEDPIINYEDSGHITVRFKVNIVNGGGVVMARGEGMASTRETKYAAQKRWLTANKLPEGLNKDELPREERRNSKSGQMFSVYLLETTSNPADHYNTVLKMAEKRALVGAATKLPLVSELFTQDIEPGEDATRAYVAAQADRREKNVTPKKNGIDEKKPNGNGREKIIQIVTDLDRLIRELRKYGVSNADIQARMKDLVGVDKRADLNEGQMVACIEEFEDWAARLEMDRKGGSR